PLPPGLWLVDGCRCVPPILVLDHHLRPRILLRRAPGGRLAQRQGRPPGAVPGSPVSVGPNRGRVGRVVRDPVGDVAATISRRVAAFFVPRRLSGTLFPPPLLHPSFARGGLVDRPGRGAGRKLTRPTGVR